METTRARRRELASSRRAGSWSRRKAIERQREFLRKHSLAVLFVFGMFLPLAPMTLLLPSWSRGFALGMILASAAWACFFFTWQLSGVSYLHQAELAEQWTVSEVQSLTRDGEWHLVNHVLLRPWDIDHVLLGPAGVVVLETKGGSSDWTQPRHEQRLRSAARQASDNAGDIRRWLKPQTQGAAVHAGVVLWPAHRDFEMRKVGDVSLMVGSQLEAWLRSLPTGQLEREQAMEALQKIASHLEKRDAADLRLHGTAPRGIFALAADVAQYVIGAAAGVMFAGGAVSQFGLATALPMTVITAAVAHLLSTRLHQGEGLLRGFRLGAIGLSLVALVATLILVAV